MVKMMTAQRKTVGDDRQQRDGAASQRLSDARRTLYFTRSELNQLLGLYSRNVARGVWRDYAIDHRDGQALFSVFRHTHESASTRSSNRPPRGGRRGRPIHRAERPPAAARGEKPRRRPPVLPLEAGAGSERRRLRRRAALPGAPARRRCGAAGACVRGCRCAARSPCTSAAATWTPTSGIDQDTARSRCTAIGGLRQTGFSGTSGGIGTSPKKLTECPAAAAFR